MFGARIAWRTEVWILVSDAIGLVVFGIRAIVDADSRAWTVPLSLLLLAVLLASLRQRATERWVPGQPHQ